MQIWVYIVLGALVLLAIGLEHLIGNRKTNAAWDYQNMVATGAGAHGSAPRPDWAAHPTERVFKHLPPEIPGAGYWTREEAMFNCEAWCARVPGNISDLLPLRAHASRFDLDEHTLYAEFSAAPPGYQPTSWVGKDSFASYQRLWASDADGLLRIVMSSGRLVHPARVGHKTHHWIMSQNERKRRWNEWFNAVGEMTGVFSRSDTAGVAEKAGEARTAEVLAKPFFTAPRIRATIFFVLLFGGLLAFGIYTVFFYGV